MGVDHETGIAPEAAWVQKGLLFRRDGLEPVIYRNTQTGIETSELHGVSLEVFRISSTFSCGSGWRTKPSGI